MNKLKKAVVIILLIVLALGAVGVVVGMFLGAHPLQPRVGHEPATS